MSDHFEPKLYVAVGRAGGKVYESQRLMYDLLVNGYKLEPMNVKKENNMNDIEFTNLRAKNILNAVIGAKPLKQPVMSKHIIGKGRWQEPEIILKSSWDGDEVNGVMATFSKDILAKVVDTTDKAIVDAVIDFARSEGFTDVYLIDKTYIMAALESKQELDELERDLEEGQKLLEDRKATIEQLVYERDRLLRDLKDSEERNNVKDALIDEQRKKIEEMRDELLALRNKNKCLVDGIHTRDNTIARGKSENIRLEGELNGARAKLYLYRDCVGDDPRAAKETFMELNKECCDLHNVEANLRKTIKIRDSQIKTQAETINRYREDNKELTAANEDLNYRIKNMDKKLRDHEGNNSDNNIVIEYQKKKIHELECQLRKYKVAGMFIKASLAAAEDPEVPKYEKHS